MKRLSLTRPILGATLALLTLALVLAHAKAPAQAPAAPTQPQPPAQQQTAAQQEPPAQQQAKQAQPRIDVVFVLDTTGSMSGLIQGAKQKIFSIASRIAEGKPTPTLRLGLVAYRDVGDAYVTRRFDLTEDVDSIFTHVRTLSADGGGDTPEHVGRALGEAVSKMAWDDSSQTMKLIFLVGDAPPAQREPHWSFEKWARKAAERHITINTVRCGADPDTERAWRVASRATDGLYESLEQSGGMVAVRTPYDEELARVNEEIARRAVYAGKREARMENKARAEQMASLAPEAAAERIQYLKKTRSKGAALEAAVAVSSAPEAVGGAVDLTAQPEVLAKVAAEELPEELRQLTPEEREAKVKQLATERQALEARAAKLAAERDAWRAKNVAEKEDAFDANVMKGVKAKASKYGLKY